MRKVIPLGIGLALCSTLAMAQTPFKGKVLDENGEPVLVPRSSWLEPTEEPLQMSMVALL